MIYDVNLIQIIFHHRNKMKLVHKKTTPESGFHDGIENPFIVEQKRFDPKIQKNE
jgi:hypothetical protein